MAVMHCKRINIKNSWMSADFDPGLVSVIVPSYNRSEFLPKLVENVSAQDYRPIEIVIIDDGSTDETASIVCRDILKCQGEDGFRVRYLVQQHGGVSSARNAGLFVSRGEFIQFLDSDDRLLPKKFSIQTQCLKNRSDVDYAYCKTVQIGSTGRCNAMIGAPMDIKKPVRNIALYLWHTSGPLYRRIVCVKTGPWDEDLEMSEDWDYAARVKAITKKGCYIPEVLSQYMIHHKGQIVTDLSTGKLFSRNKAIFNVIRLIKTYGDTGRYGSDICARALVANGISGGVLGEKRFMRRNVSDALHLGRLSTICGTVLLFFAISFLPLSFVARSLELSKILRSRYGSVK